VNVQHESAPPLLLLLLLLRPEYAMQKIRIRDKHNKETARHKALRARMSK
jgi:hypothetical protein